MADANLKITISTENKSTPQINSITTALNSLAAAGVSLYALKQGFDFLKDSIEEAAQKQANLRGLQTVIENTGTSWKSVGLEVQKYLEQAEMTSMFTDDQLIPAFQQLINSGMSTKEAMVALQRAMDLAVGNKRVGDIATAVNLLGKAYQGNTEQLKRYGIEASSFTGLMDQINEKHSGANVDQLTTYAGQIKLLETNWKNLKQSIGEEVIPTLKELTGFINENWEQLKFLANVLIPMGPVKGAAAAALNRKPYEGEMLSEKPAEELFSGAGMTDAQKKAEKANEDYWKKIEEQERKFYDFHNEMRFMDISQQEAIDQINADSHKKMLELKAEEERLFWENAVNLAGAASQTMTALGVASNSVFLKSVGVVLEGVQTVLKAIETMASGGIIGWALGILGVVTGVSNVYSYFRQLDELEKRNKDLLNAGITTAMPENKPYEPIQQARTVTTVERAAAPIYNNYALNYNIYTGALLGDERTLDAAFDILMRRYEDRLSLRVS